MREPEGETGAFGHPGHKPFREDLRTGIILIFFMALIIMVVAIFSNLPSHGPVQSNYTNATVTASAIFVILVLVSTFDLLLYIVTHAIGRPEGRP